MQKINHIKDVINLLEEEILEGIDNNELFKEYGLYLNEDYDSRTARKVLLWVIKPLKSEVKENKNKKLKDFKIENPFVIQDLQNKLRA